MFEGQQPAEFAFGTCHRKLQGKSVNGILEEVPSLFSKERAIHGERYIQALIGRVQVVLDRQGGNFYSRGDIKNLQKEL